MARLVWASLLIDPKDIAPVAKRLTISFASSTSSIAIGFFEKSSAFLILKRPLNVINFSFCIFRESAYFL